VARAEGKRSTVTKRKQGRQSPTSISVQTQIRCVGRQPITGRMGAKEGAAGLRTEGRISEGDPVTSRSPSGGLSKSAEDTRSQRGEEIIN